MERTAVLMTVYNRKAKTLACLRSLCAIEGWDDIYIVDGGSSDGTPQAVASEFPQAALKVCDGLFWAGGMREAWKMADDSGKDYSRYLLINDDTVLYPQALTELEAAEAAFPGGVYMGATKDPETGRCSYGGRRLNRKEHEKSALVEPNGSLQLVDLGNANVMIVSREVYEKVGGFCEAYTHGIADYDFTLSAQKAGCPVVLAANYCGECRDDHGNSWKSQGSSLKERIGYLYSPKGLAYKEYMFYVRKFFPKDVIALTFKLWLKTLLPKLWDLKKSNEWIRKVLRY